MKKPMKKPLIPSQTQVAAAMPPLHTAPYPNPAIAVGPTHDDIARRAYDIYVKGGRKQGHSTKNWTEAEQALRANASAANAARKELP